ncbi:hypothetical protein POM88_040835 [Heracleum sosnowskyi]|uniref:Cyclin C-terminal domain-containing protein n=1 Tax=Heracleum sosnowskyi TaxID=360622 RepID=A0AAD8HDP4_9APIA|nr:hypothetical protein POM88_040835 [Heracleum sosnowskyi]
MFSWSDTSSLQFHQILRWKTSSAVYAARCTLNKCPFLTETLKHYTGYSAVQLRDCAKPLVSYHAAFPEKKKNSDIYGPWKNKSFSDFGMATQCVSPTRINDHYLTNVFVKINSKLGATNILLALEIVVFRDGVSES